METNNTSNRIHPLLAAAAVSVILVSLVGVAAITGILPNSHSSNAQESVAASANPTAPATISTAADKPAVTDNKLVQDSIANSSEKPPAALPVTSHRTHSTSAAPAPHSPSRPAHRSEATANAQAPTICASCGRVESVQSIQHEAKPSGVGVVAGAVLGGVLGNQVGGGNGRTLATVAGAVGGGYAGNEVEKRTRSTTSYQVRVRMEDGSVRTFPYATEPGWGAGDRVRVVNGSLTARG